MAWSTTHTRHDDIHEYGLSDGCERCAQIGRRPFENLDDDALRAVALRVRDDLDPRSENEAEAMLTVGNVVRFWERLERIGAV